MKKIIKMLMCISLLISLLGNAVLVSSVGGMSGGSYTPIPRPEGGSPSVVPTPEGGSSSDESDDEMPTKYEAIVDTNYITVDNETFEAEVNIKLHENTIFSPVRLLAEALSAVAEWNLDTRELTFTIGDKDVVAGYEDGTCVLIEGWTYVNLEYIFNEFLADNYTITADETKIVAQIIREILPQTITVADFGEKTYGVDTEFNLVVTKDSTSNLENFTYASSDEAVATVDADGKVTIVGAGEAEISVTEAGDEDYATTTVKKTLVVAKKTLTVQGVDLDEKTAVLDGIVEGDEVVADLSAVSISKNDDNTTVTVTGLALSGADADNYVLTDAPVTTEYDFAKIITVTATEPTNGTVTGTGDYIIGTDVTVTATPNSGYNFSGWYTLQEKVVEDAEPEAEPEYEEVELSKTAEYTFTAEEDIELIAKFTKRSGGGSLGGGVSSYTVKFDTDGGSDVTAQTVSYNKTATEPTAPTKDGFTFDGWYTNEEFTTKYDFTSKVTKSFTLYAKWIENKVEEPTDDTSAPTENPFADVDTGDWFYDAVMFVFENGIASGMTSTEYAPDVKVTRAQFVTMLCNAYGIEPRTGDNFDDAGDTWYTGYLAAVKQLGISTGIGDNKFAPEAEITREQMVTMLYNYLKSIGEVGEVASETTFADNDSISAWAKEAVAFANENGYVSGKGENMFDPHGTATRAELAQIFYNILG